jgi:hypothetical protein
MIRIGSIVIHCYEFERMVAFGGRLCARLRAVAGLSFVILRAVAPTFRCGHEIAVTGGEVGCTWTCIPTASRKRSVACSQSERNDIRGAIRTTLIACLTGAGRQSFLRRAKATWQVRGREWLSWRPFTVRTSRLPAHNYLLWSKAKLQTETPSAAPRRIGYCAYINSIR